MKFLILFFAFISQLVAADLYVIAHKDSAIEQLSLPALQGLYSGDRQHINDSRIIPLDQDIQSENYGLFYDVVIDKPMPQIISHWSKLIFTGKGQAPISLYGNESILSFVQNNPSAIGYINSRSLNNTVKVIHKIKIKQYKELNIDNYKNR